MRRFGTLGVLGIVGALALPSTASAYTAEQRAACMGDAVMLCPAAIPNKARIAACLGAKMSQLSPRCRAQFEQARTAARQ